MGFFKVYQDSDTDSTLISNRFIDERMQAANEAQLKIYLYLLRMMGAGLGTSIGSIADKFNYTEQDVRRALRYWEKCRILALSYDERQNITGIRLFDMDAQESPQPITITAANGALSTYPAAPALPVGSGGVAEPNFGVVPLDARAAFGAAATGAQGALEALGAQGAPEEELRDVRPILERMSPAPAKQPTRQEYARDVLQAFQSDENSARLLFVAEQYLRRPLSENDIAVIYFIRDQLGFSEDLTDYLLQYCVDRGKRDRRYIEKVALNWAAKGITTIRQAASFGGMYDQSYYKIMRALGKSQGPTETEAAYIARWQNAYGFGMDVILEACARTVLATDSHRFAYAEGILKRWHEAGVHHKSDIPALDEAARKGQSRRPAPANKFNQFKQHDYDFDAIQQALEKEILTN